MEQILTNIFKRKSIIPIKFQLFDANDPTLPISTAQATLDVVKISDGIAGDSFEEPSILKTHKGNLFRYDEEEQ